MDFLKKNLKLVVVALITTLFIGLLIPRSSSYEYVETVSVKKDINEYAEFNNKTFKNALYEEGFRTSENIYFVFKYNREMVKDEVIASVNNIIDTEIKDAENLCKYTKPEHKNCYLIFVSSNYTATNQVPKSEDRLATTILEYRKDIDTKKYAASTISIRK